MLKPIRFILAINLILLFAATVLPADRVHALNVDRKSGNLPLLSAFVDQVKNGQSGELRGIYVPEVLAIPVVGQPSGNNAFVSPRANIITQFGLASQVGSTGLLAHNYLAGESFFLLKKDQKFHLIYGDGQVSTFVVAEILRYQALEPSSTSSSFVSLESNELLSSSELFSKVYERPGNVILQTCILRDNNPSWGRLFVIAKPDTP